MALYTPAPAKIQGTDVLYDQPASVNIENINPNTSRSISFPAGIPSVSLIKTWQYIMQNYQSDTWITWYESPNSVAKINFKYVYNVHWQYSFEFIYNNEILVTANFQDNNDVIPNHLNDGYIGVVFMQDQNIVAIVTSDMYFGAFAYLANNRRFANISVETYLSDSAPIVYNWIPVEQLSGNQDQFCMNLSQIKSEYIGDAFTAVTTTDRERFIFSSQANIARLIANVPNNFETVIAYSGNNYMTVTRRFSEGIPPYNNIFFKFKFYDVSDTLLYETEEYGISEPAISYMYLSFIYDSEKETGWIDLIEESLTNDNIIYNDPPANLPTAQDLNNIWLWLQASIETETEDDPYSTGSTDDGGDPGNPRPQDHIYDTPAPTLSGLNLGIITLYNPDDYELGKISQFLWSEDVLDNFKKYFNNFADNILALYVLPFTPANLPTKAFTVGKMSSEDTALQAVSYCTQRYFDIDMGSVQIDKRWGSYLDYAPYTRIEVYLPYCGLHSLDIDELMSPAKQNGTLPTDQGCILSLKYRLDILTGVIVAKLSVNGEIRYQFNGKVGSNIPLTGQTFSNLLGAIVGAAGGAAVTVASGGMTAPLAVGAAASAAGTVMAQKPNVESVGNISADASMLATKIPYVRISSPNKPLLENQQDFTGFPSYKSGTLSQFSGYTEVLEAHIEGIACTEEERSEILTLLKAGVIL